MDWEHKLHALNTLTECRLCMREPGDWYVESEMTIKEENTLVVTYGEGADPSDAVYNHWSIFVTDLPKKHCIWVSDRKKYYRWNKFLWEEVTPPSKGKNENENRPIHKA
jgi:hypothetical protein